MSTFNCPEEVHLAEKLIELHPWADMVRFARSGGEANAIAVRIGRAASGRDGIAICGYHGWHDWYLAANLADERHLDGHLLPGLSTLGVPRELAGSVHPFPYNDLKFLQKLTTEKSIGVIKMEVTRNFGPEPGFLQGVRDLCDQKNIVLIFDECTSGFRQCLGGLHLLHDVMPDLATFGKALGNGYAISAVIGKKSVMDVAQSTFISSTFWTERIGPAAALKTLEVMHREKSWDIVNTYGSEIQSKWRKLFQEYGFSVSINGLPAICSYAFEEENNQIMRTYVTQEMLARGFLSTPLVYVSITHTPRLIERYFEALEETIASLRLLCDKGEVEEKLLGPVCHSGFKRLN